MENRKMETKDLRKKLEAVLEALGENEAPECIEYIEEQFVGDDELFCE